MLPSVDFQQQLVALQEIRKSGIEAGLPEEEVDRIISTVHARVYAATVGIFFLTMFVYVVLALLGIVH